MLIPLAIINHFKPTRELPHDKQLHELYPVGTEGNDFTLPRDQRLLTWRNFFLRADRVLKLLEPWHSRPLAPAGARGSGTLDGRANRGGERWIGRGLPGDAQFHHRLARTRLSEGPSALSKGARRFLGVFSSDDPEDFRIQPCLSPVWDTAINIIALAESGFPAQHPALQKAAQWLVDKEVRVRCDWTVNNPHPEASGWAFEYNNIFYPDTDDTAMVLMALRLVRPNEQAGAGEDLRSRARLAVEFPMPATAAGRPSTRMSRAIGWRTCRSPITTRSSTRPAAT